MIKNQLEEIKSLTYDHIQKLVQQKKSQSVESAYHSEYPRKHNIQDIQYRQLYKKESYEQQNVNIQNLQNQPQNLNLNSVQSSINSFPQLQTQQSQNNQQQNNNQTQQPQSQNQNLQQQQQQYNQQQQQLQENIDIIKEFKNFNSDYPQNLDLMINDIIDFSQQNPEIDIKQKSFETNFYTPSYVNYINIIEKIPIYNKFKFTFKNGFLHLHQYKRKQIKDIYQQDLDESLDFLENFEQKYQNYNTKNSFKTNNQIISEEYINYVKKYCYSPEKIIQTQSENNLNPNPNLNLNPNLNPNPNPTLNLNQYLINQNKINFQELHQLMIQTVNMYLQTIIMINSSQTILNWKNSPVQIRSELQNQDNLNLNQSQQNCQSNNSNIIPYKLFFNNDQFWTHVEEFIFQNSVKEIKNSFQGKLMIPMYEIQFCPRKDQYVILSYLEDPEYERKKQFDPTCPLIQKYTPFIIKQYQTSNQKKSFINELKVNQVLYKDLQSGLNIEGFKKNHVQLIIQKSLNKSDNLRDKIIFQPAGACSLKNLIDFRQQIDLAWPEQEILLFFAELLNNVKLWKEKKIVHGDIRPQNIQVQFNLKKHDQIGRFDPQTKVNKITKGLNLFFINFGNFGALEKYPGFCIPKYYNSEKMKEFLNTEQMTFDRIYSFEVQSIARIIQEIIFHDFELKNPKINEQFLQQYQKYGTELLEFLEENYQSIYSKYQQKFPYIFDILESILSLNVTDIPVLENTLQKILQNYKNQNLIEDYYYYNMITDQIQNQPNLHKNQHFKSYEDIIYQIKTQNDLKCFRYNTMDRIKLYRMIGEYRICNFLIEQNFKIEQNFEKHNFHEKEYRNLIELSDKILEKIIKNHLNFPQSQENYQIHNKFQSQQNGNPQKTPNILQEFIQEYQKNFQKILEQKIQENFFKNQKDLEKPQQNFSKKIYPFQNSLIQFNSPEEKDIFNYIIQNFNYKEINKFMKQLDLQSVYLNDYEDIFFKLKPMIQDVQEKVLEMLTTFKDPKLQKDYFNLYKNPSQIQQISEKENLDHIFYLKLAQIDGVMVSTIYSHINSKITKEEQEQFLLSIQPWTKMVQSQEQLEKIPSSNSDISNNNNNQIQLQQKQQNSQYNLSFEKILKENTRLKISFVNNQKQLDLTILDKKEFKNIHWPLELVFLFEKLAQDLVYSQKNNMGLIYGYKALTLKRRYLGGKSIELIDTLCTIGNSLYYSKKTIESIIFIQESADISINKYGPFHQEVATQFNNIAYIYNHINQQRDALKYHEKCLKVRLNWYGELRQEVATSYFNVAISLYKLQQYSKAKEYFFKSIQIYTTLIESQNHPKIAELYYFLAQIESQQQNYQQAFNYHAKAYTIRKSQYLQSRKIDQTQDLIQSLEGLYQICQKQDKGEQCLQYLKMQLKLQKMKGKQINIGITILNISNSYKILNKQEQCFFLMKVATQYIYELNGPKSNQFKNIKNSYDILKKQFQNQNISFERSLQYLVEQISEQPHDFYYYTLKLQNQKVIGEDYILGLVLDYIFGEFQHEELQIKEFLFGRNQNLNKHIDTYLQPLEQNFEEPIEQIKQYLDQQRLFYNNDKTKKISRGTYWKEKISYKYIAQERYWQTKERLIIQDKQPPRKIQFQERIQIDIENKIAQHLTDTNINWDQKFPFEQELEEELLIVKNANNQK
ncbi:Protein kinase-like domain [Pseudocohnilembus persalinus]|uniref:Protein kinase-like domain n=1 Tax=Pseudocohnilembus persalinus TaxID=266149 RepID=A0A0V0QLS8_PSEPJ|nr:Protein kinase-like domain [Pseudocohnilembus persalinus]|eukprot:KRX03283.1 Protein kinase-like domain [Pseudocohnilembus persalinus]